MSKNNRAIKTKFIKELEANPLVERACRKLGVSRATFYRWREQDSMFRHDVVSAQEKGRDKLNDFAESKLLENINANIHAAIVFWLMHNKRNYRPHLKRIYSDENEILRKEMSGQSRLVDELVNIIGMDELLRRMGEVDLKTYRAKIMKEKKDLGLLD